MSIADKTKDIVVKSKDSIINTIDANGNGEIDIEDFIILGLRTPGIRVNRSDFLKKELLKNYPQEVIDDAISYNPAHAKIPVNEIDKIADEVIKFERNCVSGISTALGMPGGCSYGCYNSCRYCSILWLYVKSCSKTYVSIWISRN